METRRCIPCAGSGKVLGGGMMIQDCDHCYGKGKITEPDNEIDYLQIKTTDSYKAAINKIKATDEKISDKDAEEIFKKEFDKIDDKYELPKKVKSGDEIALESKNNFIITQSGTMKLEDSPKKNISQAMAEELDLLITAPKKRGRPKK